MANTFLVTLHGVSLALPDGSVLFDNLHETLGNETVGLIGRNGSGKTSFGKLVSGLLEPGAGRIERSVAVYHVSQQTGPARASSLAQLAGLDQPLSALRRLAGGNGTAADVDTLADRWDIEARWLALLDRAGLDESLAPSALSGGQRMLLALIGGFCSGAGLLVLDEPSNHLDRQHRQILADEIACWRQAGRGLLLITHDRRLLANVDRTLETAPPVLRRYGGGWDTVEQQRAAELAAASARLERARTERRREDAAMRNEAERAARKASRGTRERYTGSQSKLLLDAMKERAERSTGAQAERHVLRRQDLQREVSDAYLALDGALERPSFPALDTDVAAGRNTLVFDALLAPWGWSRPFSWTAQGPVRVAIRGPNACGKTTLLRLISGQLAPRSGHCHTPLPTTLLDQSLAVLDRDRSVLAQLVDGAQGYPEGRLRQYLALAGIPGGRVHQPAGELSGGEQMRAALLCAALRQPAAQLLLFDEPTNHLDLAATEALEAMLESWRGALVVVSHDEDFLERLQLSHSIERSGAGWVVQPMSSGRNI
jgi:ATPase subunit of ABC transporter with duplicated ATPase domains